MKVQSIWKVPAPCMKAFKSKMVKAGLRQDHPSTLMNFYAGYNYFYETEESFGDITEESALKVAETNHLAIRHFMQKTVEQQQEIENALRNSSKEVLCHFQQVSHLLALWMECESEIKNTQYPSCAPDWFYPYVNSL